MNMIKKAITVLMMWSCCCLLAPAQVGTWRNYLAYHDVQQIQAAGNELFVLANNDLYQYNKTDQSITTYDKTNGLSDTNIQEIRWCQQAKRLIAVYSNMNIDLVETNGNITNISDIYNKVIIGEKTLKNVYIYNQYAYLACGFGIVKVNMQRAEISESYMFGYAVSDITISGNTIYAKTSNGTLEAQLSDNLIDTGNWHQTTSAPTFTQDNTDYEENIDLVNTLQPGGPEDNYFGKLRICNNALYTVNGLMSQKATIQVMDSNREWTMYETDLEGRLGHRFLGLVGIDVNPNDATSVMICGQTGVYEYKNGKYVREYTNDNSPLQTAKTVGNNNKEYVIVSDGIFDAVGNYWCLNSVSPSTSVLQLTTNGEWIDHHSEKLMLSNGWSMDEMQSLVFDQDGVLWFTNNYYRVPAAVSYDIAAKECTVYDNFTNQDGTTTSLDGARCVAVDHDNNIWVGTNAGLFVLQRSDIKAGITTYTQIKVPRNDGTNYADYLLSGIDISAIAVDKGNRKWIGTHTNGVYLISADNMQQIYHFTIDNTPLLSDNILSIAINDNTGEVFFGTEGGLCSYISDATTTNEEMTSDNVYAYPNPVTPGYTGPINIVGLSYNADVKILAANGALVAEGRSNGGSFTWNGCDQRGNRVASGVYMVNTAKSDGSKGTVCKIAIIN